MAASSIALGVGVWYVDTETVPSRTRNERKGAENPGHRNRPRSRTHRFQHGQALQPPVRLAQAFHAGLAMKLTSSDILAGLMPAVTDRLVRVARFR
jgi:hypothetical protein